MNDSHKQHPTDGQAKQKRLGGWGMEGCWETLESNQPLKMWKQQALSQWEGEV